ncbi:Hemolysin-like protein [Ignavibacterium album JCM 16511]|uniref:Hemolysin-like protein n=1 Tax=Ignavibacterium album (strain DSM 19864 / JCM 16511 / NBRC 101810 / Mat9-16) TaxID=945713 RepID=I0ALF7_IGNAJ|nr:hemolysin family protein [Ignavibacterium album]AFH49814.1 Hemolysin-like protein [Ignavibacterium album JCM 16511]
MFTEIFLLIILLVLSAYFSSTEMAYIAANKLKLEVKTRKKDLISKNVAYYINNPDTFFSTILLGNNIVNIAFASLSAVILSSLFNFNEIQILSITTILLLFFGELIPKYFAHETADFLIIISSSVLRIITIILFPFIKSLVFISEKLTSTLSSQKAENISQLFDKEDIKALLDEGHKAGKVLPQEKNIIERVIDLGEQKVYEAMRPRTEIVGIEIHSSIEHVHKAFIDSGYSKLIVYEENLDNIKGVILAKDLFIKPKSVNEVLREIKFYPETKRSLEVLNELLESKISIAVVVDEFGGTAGIVTMEDIIEELFGEIKDEYDVEENICRRISADTYLISGKVEIDHLNEKYKIGIPEGDYETIAGYVENRIGRIPKQGESFLIDNYDIIVVKATQTKIELLKLIVRNE